MEDGYEVGFLDRPMRRVEFIAEVCMSELEVGDDLVQPLLWNLCKKGIANMDGLMVSGHVRDFSEICLMVSVRFVSVMVRTRKDAGKRAELCLRGSVKAAESFLQLRADAFVEDELVWNRHVIAAEEFFFEDNEVVTGEIHRLVRERILLVIDRRGESDDGHLVVVDCGIRAEGIGGVVEVDGRDFGGGCLRAGDGM